MADLVHPYDSIRSSSPTMKGDIIYLGNGNKRFYAIDYVKKEMVWYINTTGHIDTSATLDGDALFFGTGDGVIYAINRGNGEEMWRFEAKAEVLSSPLVVDDMLYVASADDRLYCLDKKTGKAHWQYGRGGVRHIGSRIMASPAGGGGRVYHIFSDGYLLSFDGRTGRVVWERRMFEPSLPNVVRGRKTPLITGDSLFIIDREGVVTQIDRENGELLGRYDQLKAIDFLARDDTLFLMGKDSIAAVELESGDIRWQQGLDGVSPLSTFGAGGFIFVLSNRETKPLGLNLFSEKRGRIEVFHSSDGRRQIVDEFDSTITANAVFSKTHLIVVADEGFLVIYSQD
ncbi:MAG: PQQ-binding-like beta-propeller repeat protein [Thermodesulfobacteriota bacterium]